MAGIFRGAANHLARLARFSLKNVPKPSKARAATPHRGNTPNQLPNLSSTVKRSEKKRMTMDDNVDDGEDTKNTKPF